MTIRKGSVLFIIDKNLRLRYKRLFFLNTRFDMSLEGISGHRKKIPERSKKLRIYYLFTETQVL